MWSLNKAFYIALRELYKEPLAKFLAEPFGKVSGRASGSF